MRYAEGENGRIKFNDFFPREIFGLQRYEFFGNNAKVILFFLFVIGSMVFCKQKV